MPDISPQHANYNRVSKALAYLIKHQPHQPSLAEVSAFVGLSDAHLQRIFTEWAGVSPKQFLQYITKENAKLQLREHGVADSALASGLSGSSRLHDLMIRCEAVTPGEYRQFGQGLELTYGVHSCPFGYCFIAQTHRGICKLAFFDTDKEEHEIVQELNTEWPEAKINRDERRTKSVFDQVFTPSTGVQQAITLLLKGSPFQIKVWEALLNIKDGELYSYQQVANSIEKPSAVRAVASAIAHNQVAYLIPCHRVIRGSGVLNNYRWGEERKAAMIGLEGCSEALR